MPVRHLPRFVLALAISVPAATFAAPNYAVTSLGNLGGYRSQPRAMNNAGQVVGWALDADGFQHAFISSAGMMTSLPSGVSNAIDINDAGTIVAQGSGGPILLYADGATTGLGGARDFIPYGMNNRGQVTGEYKTFNGAIYTPGLGYQPFKQGNEFNTSGRAINDNGVVLGMDSGYPRDQPDMPMWRPFTYDTAGFHQLGTLGGWGYTVAINNSRYGVGYAQVGTASLAHAVMWNPDGSVTDLGHLLGDEMPSWANGINSHGEIVGGYGLGGSDNRGFLYSGGVMYDLGALTSFDADGNPMAIGTAWDINDNHQIAAEVYDDPAGEGRGILLTLVSPVPEPAQFALLLPGLLVLAWARRGRAC
jgi:probable HAF family extracellular repeat protein